MVSQELQKPKLDFFIACGSASNNYTFSFKFDFTGNVFNSDNQFIILLSDANGNFTNGQEVGRITDSNYNVWFVDIPGSFKLPPNTYGSGYKLRIKSTSPEKISPDSDSFEAYYIIPKRLILNDFNNASICTSGTTTQISLNDIGSGLTYKWYRNGSLFSTGTDKSITITQPGEYYAAVDYGGCGDIIKSNKIQVTGFATNGVSIQGNSIVELCGTETYQLKANIDNTDYSYQWYKNDTLIDNLPDYSPVYTTDSSNQYGVYKVTMSSSNGCSSTSDAVTIKEPDGANFTIEPNGEIVNILLPYETIELSITDNANSPTYQWYKNGNPLLGLTQSAMNAINEGEYYVEVTDNTTSCPSVKKSPTFTVLNAEKILTSIEVDNEYIECESSNVKLSISSIKALASDGNSYDLTAEQIATLSFQWFKDNTPINNATGQFIELNSYNENAAYYVKTSVDILNDDSNVIQVLLSSGATEIQSTSKSNTLCPGGSIKLSIDTLAGYTYTWFDENGEIATPDPSNIEITEVGKYRLVVEGFGCNKSTEIDIIEFNDDAVEVSPSTVAVLDKGGTVIVSASGGESYTWYDSDENILSTNSTLEITELGTYKVVAKSGICDVIKQIEVVEDDGGLIIPNVVSPFNDDGVNDTWQIPNRYAFQQNVNVIIYNSRGKEIFNTTDYQNNWPETSTVKGGTLYYFKVIRDQTLVKAGTISILK